MQRVFIWHFTEKYRVFEGIDSESNYFLNSGNLKENSAAWKTPAITDASESRERQSLGDFPATTCFCHLVSQSAANELGDIFERDGVLLPVEIRDADVSEPYYLFYCKNVVDCLNLKNSKIKYSPLRPEEVVMIMEPHFIQNRIPRDQLFVVPENPSGHIYVPEGVKDRVQAAGLEGMVLLDQPFGGKAWISKRKKK